MAITEDDLQKIFGAKKVNKHPSEEELEFLEKRSQLESDLSPMMSINLYEYYYELFCEYGLEEKMLEMVEPHIRYLCRFEPCKLLESTFYKRFKDKKIIQRYVEENIKLKKPTADE